MNTFIVPQWCIQAIDANVPEFTFVTDDSLTALDKFDRLMQRYSGGPQPMELEECRQAMDNGEPSYSFEATDDISIVITLVDLEDEPIERKIT